MPLSSIIGFVADNCTIMMGNDGDYSWLSSTAEKKILYVFVLRCIRHSLALCANAASKRLPPWLFLLLSKKQKK